MLSALITIALALATALPASADIYRYRDSSGKLVITNQPPPAGAVVESQRPSQDKPTAEEVQDAYDELGITPEPKRREPRPAPEPTLSYVDLHPIEHSSYVERSNVYWKRFVTGRVKNRSGRTTATDVTVRAECTAGGLPADSGTAYLGTIGPRGETTFQIPIILDVAHYWKDGHRYTVEVGTVRCSTKVTYQKEL